MKNKYLLSIALAGSLFFSGKALAQQAEGMSYQASFRNSSGPVAGATVKMQFTLISDSATGATVYRETQTATSTSLGVVNCTIGKGTASIGAWNKVAWDAHPMYINVQADTAGGSAFVDLGTSELAASPFAKNAGGITMFPNGTSNPYKMVVSHSPAYPSWGLRYNDTLDEFAFVGGGNPSVTISSWAGNINAHNAYAPTTHPYSSNSYGNIAADGNITTGNKVQRGADTSNMLAIAWGTITSSGTIMNASNNVSVAAHTPSSGIFDIAIAGESYDYLTYTTIVSSGGVGFISWGALGGDLRVFTYNTTGTLTDQYFTFVTYKK